MKSSQLAVAGLALSMLLSSLGTSSANVALPTLAEFFGAPLPAVKWVVVAYLLAITVSSVVAGRLGDRFGRRRLLLAGLGAFAAASIFAALATGLEVLVVARAAQGLGGALMMALSVAFVRETVPASRIGRAMGLLGSTSAVGTALGPALGGLLIDLFGWRALFLVNVPLALLAALLVARYAPADRRRAAAARPEIVWSAELAAGLGATLLVATVLMSTLVVGPFYLAHALQLEAGLVGVVMAAGPIVAALTGVPAGRLVDRFGAQKATLAGLGGVGIGAASLVTMPGSLGTVGYVAPLVVLTAGYALFQTANNTAVMQAVGAEQGGLASGALNLARNLGLIAGAAGMSEVFSLGVGSNDMATAPAAAVATGMKTTFAFATGLVILAFAIVSRRSRGWLRAAACVAVLIAARPALAQDAPLGKLELRSEDGSNSVRVVGLVQLQAAHEWKSDAPDESAVLVNRARIGLVGNLFGKDLRYVFIAELGGGDPRLLFLSVDYELVPEWLAVRVGQFKRPFSRPFITMAGELGTIDRPPTVGPKVFGDDADVGVMLHSGPARGGLEYALGAFRGGVSAQPDGVHPLVATRVGWGSPGLEPYQESDLAGGPPRFGVAAAALADFDGDDDGSSVANGLVDVLFKVHGLSLSSALHVGSEQDGPSWLSRRLGALGHYTQVGQVIAHRVEPVVRYSFLRPAHGADQHDFTGGFNVFFHGHAIKWQSFATLRLEPSERSNGRDLRLQTQLSIAF
ncbi:MAG: MFS transporter [Myxococcales bacterium]|nr:MFS transporter [Myxococcales bacterium]